MNTSKNLLNKIFLVTGASRGIGRAVAKTLGANGATVILLARTIKNLEYVYDEIVELGGPTPAIYPFNLQTANPDDYAELRRNIDKNFGVLDGLINIAGTTGPLTPLEQYPLDKWFEVFQLNLHGSFMITQTLLPLIKRAKPGNIIFTTNKLGTKSQAFSGAYGISNSSVESMAKILQSELEDITSVNVKVITPDKVKTSLFTSMYPALEESQLQSADEASKEYLEVIA